MTAERKLKISDLEFTNKLNLESSKSLHVFHVFVEVLQPALSESLTISDFFLDNDQLDTHLLYFTIRLL